MLSCFGHYNHSYLLTYLLVSETTTVGKQNTMTTVQNIKLTLSNVTWANVGHQKGSTHTHINHCVIGCAVVQQHCKADQPFNQRWILNLLPIPLHLNLQTSKYVHKCCPPYLLMCETVFRDIILHTTTQSVRFFWQCVTVKVEFCIRDVIFPVFYIYNYNVNLQSFYKLNTINYLWWKSP